MASLGGWFRRFSIRARRLPEEPAAPRSSETPIESTDSGEPDSDSDSLAGFAQSMAPPHVPGGAIAVTGSVLGAVGSAESELDEFAARIAEREEGQLRAGDSDETPEPQTRVEFTGDQAPDFEPVVEEPDALSGESKLLLDDAGPDMGHEGAAGHFREGDPFDQIEEGPLGGVPDSLGVDDLWRVGGPDSKGDELAGVEPGSLGDPRLGEGLGGGLGFVADNAAHTSELSQRLGNPGVMSERYLQKLGNLKAGDIVGDDTQSRLARAQTHQEIGSTPDPADQQAADEEADKVPSPGTDPSGGDPSGGDPSGSDPSGGGTEGGGTESGGTEGGGSGGDEVPDAIAGGPGPDITPNPDDPYGGPQPLGQQPFPVPEDPFEQKPDRFDTLIQPSPDPEGGDMRPPEAIAARLDASLEERQAPFTDPHPDESGDDEWEDPFRELPGGLGLPGVDEADSLIDPPETLEGGVFGSEGPVGPGAVESEDGIDDEALDDLGP